MGRTRLHWAVQTSNASAIAELLASGASANLEDRAGATPLHFAAFMQGATDQSSTLNALLDARANVSAQDQNGQTSLHWLAAVCQSSADIEVVQMLLHAGADVHATDHLGNTPLHLAAASSSCIDVLPWLMTPTATVNIYGDTPLHTAAGFGNCSIVHCLIQYYSNRLVGLFEACVLACTNNAGQTPLQLAVLAGFNLAAVKLLTECQDDGARTATLISQVLPHSWRQPIKDFCIAQAMTQGTQLWPLRTAGSVPTMSARVRWGLCFRMCVLSLRGESFFMFVSDTFLDSLSAGNT